MFVGFEYLCLFSNLVKLESSVALNQPLTGMFRSDVAFLVELLPGRDSFELSQVRR